MKTWAVIGLVAITVVSGDIGRVYTALCQAEYSEDAIAVEYGGVVSCMYEADPTEQGEA